MENLEDKTILVTGATDGIGKLTAKGLAELGATVFVHGRSAWRVEDLVGEVISATGNDRVVGFRADFACFAEVREMADKILSTGERLDILINNAGMGAGKRDDRERVLSRDGLEMRFQVNHLSTFLLTRLLLPALEDAPSARIVNVSSLGQAPIDFTNVMLDHDYDGLHAYCQSKLAMVMF